MDMRKIVVQEFVTIDGFAAGPGDSVDFIPESTQGDQALGREQLELLERTDTLLLGRVTYEMFAAYWPEVTEGEEKEFADKFNGLDRIVFSRTLERAPWGSWPEGIVVSGHPVDEVSKRKQEPGKDMMVSGSLSLVQTLTDAGLVDEFRLVLCPVVLGGGRPLLPQGSGPIHMQLVRATALDRGGVSLIYRPREAASASG
jgi:dihydrofolate reductase